MNEIKFTPLFSVLKYISLKIRKMVFYPLNKIGSQASSLNKDIFTIFLEVKLLSKKNIPIEGQVIFKILFYNPKVSSERFIRMSKLTVPFFVGLPGFCNKQFIVNRDKQLFSGIYEWETIEAAQQYVHSFALKSMKFWSNPYPIEYEIIDKKTKNIIENKIL